MQLEEEKAKRERARERERENKEKGVAVAGGDQEKGRNKRKETEKETLLRQEDKREQEARKGRDSAVTSRLRSHTCARLNFDSSQPLTLSVVTCCKKLEPRASTLEDTLNADLFYYIDNFFCNVFLTLNFSRSLRCRV